MLAFVFWHWPFPEVDSQSYEGRLTRFHQALAGARPEGFRHSVAFRVHGATWTVAGDRAYEDWYLLDDSRAIDPLNEAAVSRDRQEPHDMVAEAAAGGTGGLYQLKEGVPDVAGARYALWLAKPRGARYDEFYARLQPWTERAGVSLWRRHLVLGPTAEFCVLAPSSPAPPMAETVSTTRLDLVWP